MDVVLFANEWMNSRKNYQNNGVLCELDIENAFNHVN